MDITSLNSVQEETLKSFNNLVMNLNKADIEEKPCFAIVTTNQMQKDIKNLHNCLAYLLCHRDPVTEKSLWELFPDKNIESIDWEIN